VGIPTGVVAVSAVSSSDGETRAAGCDISGMYVALGICAYKYLCQRVYQVRWKFLCMKEEKAGEAVCRLHPIRSSLLFTRPSCAHIVIRSQTLHSLKSSRCVRCGLHLSLLGPCNKMPYICMVRSKTAVCRFIHSHFENNILPLPSVDLLSRI